MSANNKTSYLINSQVPGFVRDDHPTFVEFLEKYYAFLEQDGELMHTTKNFNTFMNVDLANDQFKKKLYDQYIKLIPTKSLADKDIILKNVKDFYRARGTEKSVKFIGRVLFNKEADFYYPKKDILKASDGKWFVEKSLRVTELQVNNVSNSIAQNFISHEIRGASSNATAIVENIEQFYDKGTLVTELKISGLKRDFENGEYIYTYFTEQGVDKRISARLFSGVVTSVRLLYGGAGYAEGATIPVESNTGSGAIITIARTDKGALRGIAVKTGGAGFRVNDSILITGGTGIGAAANVLTINTDQTYHPNTYQMVGSTINLEANTPIGNAVYSNINASNANVALANALSFWAYDNCGPIMTCALLANGNNYTLLPTVDVQANTAIRNLGILGRMQIVDGGINYVVGDTLEFINPIGYYGFGAAGNVSSVAANGMITGVRFTSVNGQITGGCGYEKAGFPTINIGTSTGSGGNVIVSALLGDGEEILTAADTIGTIRELRIITGGSGYETPPTLNLTAMGDGTAQATCQIVSGVFSYKGRFLNDDGLLSSYNFIQNRDYYQNYSYVVRIDESINKYRKALSDLTHPTGMKLFGEYISLDENQQLTMNHIDVLDNHYKTYDRNVATYTANIKSILVANTANITSTNGVYYQPASYSNDTINVSNIIVNLVNHGYVTGNVVELYFTSGDTANISNTQFVIVGANNDFFFVHHANTANTSGTVILETVI